MALHNLAFAGAFVVDAAKMKQSVDNHAMQLRHIFSPDSLSIAGHSVERNEHIAADAPAMRIIERYDIGKIVMIQKLPVDLDDFPVITENICEGAEDTRMITCNLVEPSTDTLKVDSRHSHAIGSPLNQIFHIR